MTEEEKIARAEYQKQYRAPLVQNLSHKAPKLPERDRDREKNWKKTLEEEHISISHLRK